LHFIFYLSLSHLDSTKFPAVSKSCTGCVSESGDFATLFFSGFGNTGADAAIAILLPTLKHFSCNGAVDWSTKCFWCESVLQKQ